MQETLLEGNLKIESAVEGLRKQSVRRLSEHGHKQNALTMVKFLLASTVESNISNRYKADLIFRNDAITKISMAKIKIMMTVK
jgi:hypothetical protein